MSECLAWNGELTTRRSLVRRGLAFLSPGMIWLMIFLVLPSLEFVLDQGKDNRLYDEAWTMIKSR